MTASLSGSTIHIIVIVLGQPYYSLSCLRSNKFLFLPLFTIKSILHLASNFYELNAGLYIYSCQIYLLGPTQISSLYKPNNQIVDKVRCKFPF